MIKYKCAQFDLFITGKRHGLLQEGNSAIHEGVLKQRTQGTSSKKKSGQHQLDPYSVIVV